MGIEWPIIAFGWIGSVLQRGVTSWGRLREVFDEQPHVKDGPQTDFSLRSVKGSIEFRNVSLKFEDFVALDDVSFKVAQGERVGLTGRTGSGKTMIVNLIARLLEPTSGEIFIDGIDIKKYPLEVLRRYIGIVPQEPFLFSDTIAENIAFGIPEDDSEARLKRIKEVAQLVQLDGDIEDFPDKYETSLGERGVTLSGGQRQRTAMARAIIRDPAILILDDALSAVDTQTEALILEGLEGVARGRTTLIVAHRISAFQKRRPGAGVGGWPHRRTGHARPARDTRRLVRRHGQAAATRSRLGGRVVADSQANPRTRQTRPDRHVGRRLRRERGQSAARRRAAQTLARHPRRGQLHRRRRNCSKKAFDWQVTRRLLRYFTPYRPQLVSGILLLLVSSALSPAFPYLIRLVIDRYINPQAAPYLTLDIDARLQGLLTIVFIYVGLKVVSFCLRYGYTYLVAWIGQHVIYDLRKEIFSKIQRMHMGFFDRTPVGRLMTRITTDVDAIQTMMTDGVVGLIADIGIITGLIVYMLIINWQLALVTLTVMPILFFTLNALRLRIRDAYRTVRLRTSRSNAYLAENLTGMKNGTDFQPRVAERSRLRRNQLGALGRLHRADSLVQPVLPERANRRLAGARGDSLLWRVPARRRAGRRGRNHRRRLVRVYPVRADVFPAAAGPERQVQHHAGGDGVVGAYLRPPRHLRANRQPPRPLKLRDEVPRRGAVRPRLVRLPK